MAENTVDNLIESYNKRHIFVSTNDCIGIKVSRFKKASSKAAFALSYILNVYTLDYILIYTFNK